MPQGVSYKGRTRGEVQREAELKFAQDTGRKSEVDKAKRNLMRLRKALAERHKGATRD